MARTDLETLVFSLEASTAKFNKSIEKLNRDFSRQMGRTETRAKQMQTRLDATFSKIGRGAVGFGKGAAAGLIGGLGVDAIVQRSRSAVASLAGIADAAEKVGASTDDIQAFRYALEQAGGAAQDADAGLVQWARHLADAKNKGNDLTKILEANNIQWRDRTPIEVMKEYADLVRDATSFTDKMTLVTAGFGKSGAEWIQALSGGAAGLDEQAAKFRAAGGFISEDQVRRGADLDDKFTHIASVLNANINSGLSSAVGHTLDWASAAESLMTTLGNASVWDAIRKALGSDPFFDTSDLILGAPGTAAVQGPPMPPGVRTTISKPSARRNVVIPSDLGGSAAAKTESEYEREVAAIKEKVAALKIEEATVGMTVQAAAEYQARQELINAALASGLKLTPALSAEIDAHAKSLGTVTSSALRAKTALESMQEAQKAFASEMSGALEGLIVDGNSLNEVLADIANNIARMAIQAAIAGTGPLAGLLGTASTTGGAGGLAGLFAGAFAGGGTIRRGQFGLVGENGPELIAAKSSSIHVIPPDQLRARASGRQSINVNINAPINAPGADAAQLQRVTMALAELKADVPRQVRAGLGAVQGRRVRV